MIHKIFISSLLVFMSFQSYADQLYKYDEIKNKLLNGQTVSASIDLKNNCRRLSSYQAAGAPPLSVPNVFSISFVQMTDSLPNNIIQATDSSLSPATQSLPSHFIVRKVLIQSFGNITVDIQTLGFESRQVIQKVTYSCSMDDGRNNGIKFFSN